jgi:histidine phosphotransfer protein HptB
MEHIDQQALATLKEVMEDDVSLLIHTFLQDSDNRLKILKELVVTPDAESLRRTAHSFKGSCSNVGAPLLAIYCAELEKKGLNRDVTNLQSDLDKILIEYEQVKTLLLAQIA